MKRYLLDTSIVAFLFRGKYGSGKMIEDFDLLIGCTAVANGLVMVTDNTKHFSRIEGIVLENWIER